MPPGQIREEGRQASRKFFDANIPIFQKEQKA